MSLLLSGVASWSCTLLVSRAPCTINMDGCGVWWVCFVSFHGDKTSARGRLRKSILHGKIFLQLWMICHHDKQSRAFRSWCILWRGNNMCSSNSARIRPCCFWCGAEKENNFPKDCHNNDSGSIIGEFFSCAGHWRDEVPSNIPCWTCLRRLERTEVKVSELHDDLARKKPAVLRQKRPWSLTSPLCQPARQSLEWVIVLYFPPADSSCGTVTTLQINQVTLPKFFYTFLSLSCQRPLMRTSTQTQTHARARTHTHTIALEIFACSACHSSSTLFFILTHTPDSGLVLAAATCLGKPVGSWETVLVLTEPRWTRWWSTTRDINDAMMITVQDVGGKCLLASLFVSLVSFFSCIFILREVPSSRLRPRLLLPSPVVALCEEHDSPSRRLIFWVSFMMNSNAKKRNSILAHTSPRIKRCAVIGDRVMLPSEELANCSTQDSYNPNEVHRCSSSRCALCRKLKTGSTFRSSLTGREYQVVCNGHMSCDSRHVVHANSADSSTLVKLPNSYDVE